MYNTLTVRTVYVTKLKFCVKIREGHVTVCMYICVSEPVIVCEGHYCVHVCIILNSDY